MLLCHVCLLQVCPQHDLLWEQLTGREHLLFYGRLKGLTGGAHSSLFLESIPLYLTISYRASFKLTLDIGDAVGFNATDKIRCTCD